MVNKYPNLNNEYTEKVICDKIKIVSEIKEIMFENNVNRQFKISTPCSEERQIKHGLFFYFNCMLYV